MKKIVIFLIGVLMVFMLYGCSEEDVVDNVSNDVQQEDENVLDKKTENSNKTESSDETNTYESEFMCNLIPGMYKTDDGEDLSISVYTSPDDNYVANMESKRIKDLNGELELIAEDTYGNRAINELLVHDVKKNVIRYEDGSKVLKVFKLVEKYES